MAWQLIFKAPEPDSESDDSARDDLDRPAPSSRKPVSMSLQVESGTRVVLAAGDDDDD